mmetsp:Transcript_846/g.496  ORF Transcript_846/g.496 Transcript_846/m.496 type:complete len:679 (+) Transcript_846:92-2128(+)
MNQSAVQDSNLAVQAALHYDELSQQFTLFHKDPVNVALHFVTTPLGLIGAFSLLNSYTKSMSTTLLITFCYLLSLLPTLPSGDFYGTVLLSLLIVFCSRAFRLTFFEAVAFVVIGYVLQDMSHIATGEPTFQGTYSSGGHIDLSNPMSWIQSFVEHVYYLLPLIVHAGMPHLRIPADVRSILDGPLPDSMRQLEAFGWLLGPLTIFALGSYCIDSKNSMCFFPGTPYFYRVVQCNLKDRDETDPVSAHDPKVDMKLIRDWAMKHEPAENMSTHFWFKELDTTEKSAFDRLANSFQIMKMFRSLFGESHYCVDILPGMNEVYITGPERREDVMNSDHVFYSRHVDGPFGFVPFVSVYRCIVGLDRNMVITTHFPLAGFGHNACEGDVLAFDFNREVHYITRDDSKRDISDKFRVTLKLHYCIYPRVLRPLGWLMGWLNTRYNMSFRALFLKTIAPTSLYEHFLAWNVNANTFLFDRIETLLGLRNVAYIFSVMALWHATGLYEVFFALTSFVHYFRYITTFYVRRGIDFGSFKRDVLLFKTLALAQIVYHYCFPSKETFVFDPISIAMIVIGYSISVMATSVIGIERTYFAAELGLVEAKWIDQFPYGYIPHPMIISQMFALLGFYKAAHFRAEWPYVVPIHLSLYLVHMLQEHFNVYQRFEPKTVTVDRHDISKLKSQ